MRVGVALKLAVVALSVSSAALAQTVPQTEPDYPRGRISGYMFGDAYFNVAGDPIHRYNGDGVDSGLVNIVADGKKIIGKDLNGVQLRRIYFQADNDLSVKFSTRFRLEVDGKSLTSDGKIGVNVKGAYLQAKNVIPRGNFLFGILTVPTFETVEEFMQYRALEKTIADLHSLGSSADLGVEMKGFVDAGHRIGYSAMIGNGTGQKPEGNRYKKSYCSMQLQPIPELKIEPYFDYEGGYKGTDKATYKLFAGLELKRVVIGAEVVDRVNHSPSGNQEPFGLSVFARTAPPTAKLAAFARYDRWQPNRRADNRVDTDLYIVGLDWQVYKDVHVIPNVEAAQYRAQGTAVAPSHNDTQARVTFYYKFSKP